MREVQKTTKTTLWSASGSGLKKELAGLSIVSGCWHGRDDRQLLTALARRPRTSDTQLGVQGVVEFVRLRSADRHR